VSEREQFLREFERALRLRGKRRTDALAEIESHIEDAVEAGEEEASVIARLGEPRDVAGALNRTATEQPALLFAAAVVFTVAVAVAAGSTSLESDRSEAIPPPTALFSVLREPATHVVPAAMRDDFLEPMLHWPDDRPAGLRVLPDQSRLRVLLRDLGPYEAWLLAVPMQNGLNLCYSLMRGGGGLCYRPGAGKRHFNVSGSERISRHTGASDVQLFGVAFDDVESLRIQVDGQWRRVPVVNNGFYLYLPGMRFHQIGAFEATLTDGSTQTYAWPSRPPRFGYAGVPRIPAVRRSSSLR
jgi:hypothetical protein